MRIITTLLLFLAPLTASAIEPDQRLHKECLYPTVKITSSVGSGSGVIVRSDKKGGKYINVVITCSHIISDDEKDIKVLTANYKNWSEFEKFTEHESKFRTKNTGADLAILTFMTDDKQLAANIAFEKLYINSKIFHIGCGLGDEARIEHGFVTAVREKRIRASLYALVGDSGGPVFHDYKIVGFLSAIRSIDSQKSGHMAILTPIENLKKMDAAFAYDFTKEIP